MKTINLIPPLLIALTCSAYSQTVCVSGNAATTTQNCTISPNGLIGLGYNQTRAKFNDVLNVGGSIDFNETFGTQGPATATGNGGTWFMGIGPTGSAGYFNDAIVASAGPNSTGINLWVVGTPSPTATLSTGAFNWSATTVTVDLNVASLGSGVFDYTFNLSNSDGDIFSGSQLMTSTGLVDPVDAYVGVRQTLCLPGENNHYSWNSLNSNQLGGTTDLCINNVPEPSSALLLGLGGIGILARRKR